MDSPEEAAYDNPGRNLGVSHPGCPREPVTPVVTLGCPWLDWVQLLPDPGVFCTESAELVPSQPLSSALPLMGALHLGNKPGQRSWFSDSRNAWLVGELPQQL